MFYDVKVFDPKGNLKKIIPSKELSRMYWNKFQREENQIATASTDRTRVPRWVKEKLMLEFPDI